MTHEESLVTACKLIGPVSCTCHVLAIHDSQGGPEKYMFCDKSQVQ